MIRVGVVGACGRMGQLVCRTVADDPELALVAAIDRSRVGESIGTIVSRPEVEVRVSDELDTLLQAEAEVAVDFTHPDVVMDNIRWLIEHAVNVVVGTTGITDDDVAEIRDLLEQEGGETNVIIAPNFSIGAVLAERFSAMAARFFPAVEIVELHHDGKADAPSGTALSMARRLARARGEVYRGPTGEVLRGVRGGDTEGIRIHSVRLPGLVAHHEILFGGQGQTLTIRHDSTDRTSFMPGVLLAIKCVHRLPGLTLGLEPLLDLPPA